MKKKLVQFLILVTFVTMTMTACGNKDAAEQSVVVEESTETEEKSSGEEITSSAPTESTEEVKENEVTIHSKDNITAWAAKNADLYDGYTEGAKVIGTLAEGTEVVITGTSSDAKYYEIKNGDGVAYVTVDGLTSEKPLGYKVTAMEATMYVLQTVNTRSGPSSDYEKTGSLSKGQEIKIIGQADTGWYQLENGSFVENSSAYIGSTKPSGTTTTPSGGGNGNPGGTGNTSLSKWQNADGSWNYEAMTEIWNGDIVLTDEASNYVFNTNPWNNEQWRAYNAWRDAKLDVLLSGGETGIDSGRYYVDETLTAQYLSACLAYCIEGTEVSDTKTANAKNTIEKNEGRGVGQFAGGVYSGTPEESANYINTYYPHVFQSGAIGVAAGYYETSSGSKTTIYIVYY